MRTLQLISRAILLGCGTCLLLLSGCSSNLSESVVIPDSKELRGAWDCPDQSGNGCRIVPERVTIDLGYLREFMQQLQVCYGEGK
jgi:hypothetical protein